MTLKIKELSKSYGNNKVLKDVSLEVNNGLFGLLGPNGAGKTTLMKILSTLTKKTTGEVTIFNIPINNKKEIRKIIGYLPQEFSLYPKMSIFEVMDYLSLLAGISDSKFRKQNINFLLEKVNLVQFKNKKVRALSGGMKRRLGIAQAIINNPKLLIVDEPTAGLDPEERIRLRNLLSEFSSDRIVLLSTHIAADIEYSCTSLAVLNRGEIIYNGTVKDIIKESTGKIWAVELNRQELNDISKKHTIISTVTRGNIVEAKLLSTSSPYPNSISVNPTLEDSYMYISRRVNDVSFLS